MNFSELLEAYRRSVITHNMEYWISYIPAHVDITPQEEADTEARDAAHLFDNNNIQSQIPISLKSFKAHLKRLRRKSWLDPNNTDHNNHRYYTMGTKRSNLSLRKNKDITRNMESLFSRYRVGEVESVGKYPRRLKMVDDDGRCRLCQRAEETPLHLVSCCEGTESYRLVHDISRSTLVHETPENILRIVEFDQWLRNRLQYDRKPPEFGLPETLQHFYQERRKRRKEYENGDIEPTQMGVRTAKHRRYSDERKRVTTDHGLLAPVQEQRQNKRKSLTQSTKVDLSSLQ